MNYEDKILTCCEENCKTNIEGLKPKQFIFTAGEQEFYAEKGYSEPKRCKSCRDAKKAEKSQNRPNNRPKKDFYSDWSAA